MIEKNNNKILLNSINKQYFVGISLGSNATAETGIAVVDRSLNLLRIDKIFNIEDLELYIKNLGPADNIIICMDLPKNTNMVNGKWRIESRHINPFKLIMPDNPKFNWAERFSDRGVEFCNTLSSLSIDTYRYYCYFTKNILKLSSPYKPRSPADCKHLQMSIKNNLKISGIPSNMIALSGLDAILGAYTAWKLSTSQENIGYKFIGDYKNTPIATAL
ncbi:MAG: hypothetical protein A2287_06700 [Candidatus Melainabacteria bacterium RIFOXYA12_FULL_32_12]|nr:MAG: hypothetical protein A2255_00215 [Candidatus Melainabacteria bacterium RIFOXYA2_FULL_32_9]OGI25420.1 MAG: hypothetical protein A2287_06700 [Candidatus Melainabacteria bacterium RIFOXYA12_FULL_32_12]